MPFGLRYSSCTSCCVVRTTNRLHREHGALVSHDAIVSAAIQHHHHRELYWHTDCHGISLVARSATARQEVENISCAVRRRAWKLTRGEQGRRKLRPALCSTLGGVALTLAIHSVQQFFCVQEVERGTRKLDVAVIDCKCCYIFGACTGFAAIDSPDVMLKGATRTGTINVEH